MQRSRKEDPAHGMGKSESALQYRVHEKIQDGEKGRQSMNIKACPHCGGNSDLNTYYSKRAKCYFVHVKCSICGARGKSYTCTDNPQDSADNKACEDAITAWNMRTGEA